MREDVQAAAPMTGMARKPAESGRCGHRGLALGLVLLAQLLVVIDVSIVTLALPAIQRAFHFSPVGLQWVLSGYALAFGGFLLLGGRLADLLGRRWILVIGAAVFTAASLACALAGSAGMLVAARALLPSRALVIGCGPPGVGLKAGEDGVADLPLQRAWPPRTAT